MGVTASMQRTVGVVLVVVLVVSAGCSGMFVGDGGGESTPTVTPMAVPTDEPTPTPVPQLAPGLTGEGIENATALVAAHASQLRNTSFTTRLNTTRLAANGSVVSQQTGMLRAGPPGSSVYSVSERNGSSPHSRFRAALVHTEVWSNGGRVVLNRTYANGTTTYDRIRIDGTGIRFGTRGALLRFILEPFGTANTSVTELERNGTTLYRVRGRIRDGGRGNVSVRLVVDPRGIIREYRSVQRTTFERNVSRIVREARFSGIGATDAPERPAWVDEALNRTTPVPNRTTVTPNAMTATPNATTETATNRTGTASTTTADTTTRR